MISVSSEWLTPLMAYSQTQETITYLPVSTVFSVLNNDCAMHRTVLRNRILQAP